MTTQEIFRRMMTPMRNLIGGEEKQGPEETVPLTGTVRDETSGGEIPPERYETTRGGTKETKEGPFRLSEFEDEEEEERK